MIHFGIFFKKKVTPGVQNNSAKMTMVAAVKFNPVEQAQILRTATRQFSSV